MKKKILIILLSVVLALALLAIGLTVANYVNEKNLTEYIKTFKKCNIEDRLVVNVDDFGNSYFVSDRDLRIMHLTDIHIGGGVFYNRTDKLALRAVADMVAAENPDLVIVTGDIAFTVPMTGSFSNAHSHRLFIALMEHLGVNYTVTFGNHDSEGYNFERRRAVAKMYADPELEYCFFERGPRDIFGEGNHMIYVKGTNGLIRNAFIMMDSNAYRGIDVFGLLWDYDRVHDDQIEWYRNTITQYKNINAENARALGIAESDITPFQSMIFMHIPIKEFNYAYHEYANNGMQNTENSKFLGGIAGESGKMVYSPEEDELLFESMLELGSTAAMFFGHDHLNNFMMEYQGVIFSYGHSIDYCAYAGIDEMYEQRGCCIIELAADNSFKIVHENYYQDKYSVVN